MLGIIFVCLLKVFVICPCKAEELPLPYYHYQYNRRAVCHVAPIYIYAKDMSFTELILKLSE